MSRIGGNRISLRSGGPWQGMNLLSKSAHGRFELIENGYVNSDGTEIRMMPGMKCVIDPETKQRELTIDTTLGYQSSHIDARRTPNSGLASNSYYRVDNASPAESMTIWTKPGILHCFEQVHGRWIIAGESDHRREPIFNNARTAWVKIVSYSDNGVNITLTVDTAPSIAAATFNSVFTGDRVFIEIGGLTGSLASILNGKQHTVAVLPAGTSIVIATTSGGVVAAVAGQNAHISRVTSNSRNPSGPSNDAFSDLTIWTCTSKGDQDTAPVELVRPAHVANRTRDFGDGPAVIFEGNQNAATTRPGISRRRSIGTPYRVVPHIAGNRLIMAAPGLGCVFQAPVIMQPNFSTVDSAAGIGAQGNDIYDRPRALGVPKAVVWEDPDKTVGATFHINAPGIPGPGVPDRVFGGTAFAARAGKYGFVFAYHDEGTGETGLASEPIFVTTDAAFSAREGIRFWIYFPGYLLHETLAACINVYRTTKGGNTFYFDRSIPVTAANSSFGILSAPSSRYGLVPETTTTDYYFHCQYDAFFISDKDLTTQLNPVPLVFEQMPMGCKAARTIRGFSFFGGALGDAGSCNEYFKGSSTLEYDGVAATVTGINPDHRELTLRHSSDTTIPISTPDVGVESWFMGGARTIPPAYAGQTIVGKDIAPMSRKSLLLDILVNTKVGWDIAAVGNLVGRYPDVRYKIVDTPLARTEDCTDPTRRGVTTFLKLPRAQLQISEPDNPNIVTATATLPLANETDDDIEGIGDMGGQAVVCTRTKTYLVAFSQSPIGVNPEIADERFGCIAANSMVSFEGGCAWMSDRGPVAFMGGSVQWIGKPLSDLFIGETARYRRDGLGMMRHSWAAHDAERSLIYFGVFADRNAGTPLEVEIPFGGAGATFSWEDLRGTASQDLAWSKFPCDEVLVYSYRVDAWSVWRPSIPIQWVTTGIDADGVNRIHFLGQDRRIYVMDDNWANGDKEVAEYTASANETITSLVTAISHVAPWKGSTISVVRTDSDGRKTLVGTSTILTESVASGITTITFGAITTQVGDRVMIGARTMRLKTNTVNFKQADTSMSGPLIASYSMESRKAINSSGVYDMFVGASLIRSRVENGIPTTRSMTVNADDPAGFTWLGTHDTSAPAREQKLAGGQSVGQGAIVDMNFLGNAQVRLQDMYIEVS